ncbi:hypothetical protein BJ508DRAFT_325071 [Ascobolus immersus RN42]|uniref:DBF4-type domain-containing protein n=1 Tax=Ascobolus immersus RN42 TaxID=1160509 RepID=A0A3N4IFI8_ASCIM|nr:hypothetical protein BJ508DRAFT_325071 [Ascobolus immersus RN42]
MASVSVAQPTHSPAPTPMSRRLPLNNVPHAVNSPLKPRTVPSNYSGKRQRQDAAVENDAPAMEPPTKKQAMTANAAPQTPVSQKTIVKEKRTSVQRKVTKQKVTTIGTKEVGVVRQENAQERDTREEVLQWQRHYRKAFPTYVIFFENIPDEQGVLLYKQVKALGSKVERFFSNTVTHVITNRTLPPDFGKLGQEKTPNALGPKKGANKVYQDRDDTDCKKADVLYKAREMGMKIWTLEKLQRMMDAMFDQTYVQQPHPTARGIVQHHALNAAPAVNDLSLALRNERINGPVDRDPTAFAPMEMVYFKGPFVLVRDLSEKCRPVLVREYPKVAAKEEGIWPQFRSVGGGKCPFIEDVSLRRPQYAEERRARQDSTKPRQIIKKESQKEEMPPPQAPRTRGKRTFAEVEGSRLNKPAGATVQAKGVQPTLDLCKPENTANEIAFTAKEAVNPLRFNREPAASGMQPSNVTSAIRSNRVSSLTNAEGGPKAPQSRDMYDLQRKAAVTSTLEKAANKVLGSKAATNIAALAQTARGTARGILEFKKALPEKKEETPAPVEIRYDPKPGYCENCKEKFDDFEEHSATRKHRKFALTASNWSELDQLLSLLPRARACYRPDESD